MFSLNTASLYSDSECLNMLTVIIKIKVYEKYCPFIMLFILSDRRSSEFAHQGAPFSNTEMTMQSRCSPFGAVQSLSAECS